MCANPKLKYGDRQSVNILVNIFVATLGCLPDFFLGYGHMNINAAIFFSFLSIFTWVNNLFLQQIALNLYKTVF
jgi:hypothetical protein